LVLTTKYTQVYIVFIIVAKIIKKTKERAFGGLLLLLSVKSVIGR